MLKNSDKKLSDKNSDLLHEISFINTTVDIFRHLVQEVENTVSAVKKLLL